MSSMLTIKLRRWASKAILLTVRFKTSSIGVLYFSMNSLVVLVIQSPSQAKAKRGRTLQKARILKKRISM